MIKPAVCADAKKPAGQARPAQARRGILERISLGAERATAQESQQAQPAQKQRVGRGFGNHFFDLEAGNP